MRKYGTKKGHSKKNRRGTRNQRRRRNKTSKKQFRGGCGGGVCTPMTGGEDPSLSTDIFNYNISDLPHSVV
jgi:hypothetical protein